MGVPFSQSQQDQDQFQGTTFEATWLININYVTFDWIEFSLFLTYVFVL